MAVYKISNKNRYGFKDHLFQTICFVIPTSILLGLFASFVFGPFLYRFYVKNTVLEQGAVGTAAAEDIPIAQSIEDMRRSEFFTLTTDGAVLKYDTIQVEGIKYHYIRLPSGEKIVAHINMKALQNTKEAGVYRLPVGQWRAWDPPEQVMIQEHNLDETDYYADMYGDYTPVLSEDDFCTILGRSAIAWIVILLIVLYRVAGVRTGRFAPAILAGRDPLLPRNNLECWCASTFAIWANSFSVTEGWPLITGAHRNRRAVSSFLSALHNQWDFDNRQDGLNTVHELIEKHAGRIGTGYPGWDLCRATQLLGMMYMVKMISREELDQEFSKAGQVIQQQFGSWDEMAESYLSGYEAWQVRIGSADAKQNTAWRKNIYNRLKENEYGPYSVPWRTDLSLHSGVGGGRERTIVKKILSVTGYRATEL